MIKNDILGLILVYLYVAVLLIATDKLAHRYSEESRKVLHIMTGNIAFILPVFQTKEIMAFLAAGPFILFTFLMSSYSPVQFLGDKVSEAGHGLGLVYYSISWFILAYVFFGHKEVIAIGTLATAYGDGLASVFGLKFGKRNYNLTGGEKSVIGSLTMFTFTFLAAISGLIFYGWVVGTVTLNYTLIIPLLMVSVIATLVEALTPKGLDNLSVPLIASFIYWWLIFGV